MRTVREISSGGIVYRKADGTIEVALIRVRGRWCLPKGQVEEGEGLMETALREVREETGLEGKVVEKLGDITYWFSNKSREGDTVKIFKRVYFYLIRCLRGDVREHDAEVEEACWVPIDKALKKLVYPTEMEMMRKAIGILEGRQPREAFSEARRASRG